MWIFSNKYFIIPTVNNIFVPTKLKTNKMSKNYKGCVVNFDHDIHEDDIEYVINAISMIKGVSSVHLNEVSSDDYFNRIRVKNELKTKLYEFLKTI